MQERSRNLRSFAGTQLNRIASSSAVNKAYDLASKAREAVTQASQSSTPPPSGNGQPQTWREWALQKLPKRGPDVVGVETVYLFPGWATRVSQNRDAGFFLKVHISGFASSLRPPEQATRSQKAFMAIARRLAALPNLPPEVQAEISTNLQQLPVSPSTQDLLQLQEDASTDRDEELRALNAELAELPAETRETLVEDAANPTIATTSIPLEQLKRMHSNLDFRLQPFWSSGVPNRPVILSIFCSNDNEQGESIETTSFTPLEEGRQPLFKIQTSTDAQGTFIQEISIPFETICTNPESLSLAFGNYDTEPKIVVQAELKPMLQIQPPEAEGYIRETKTIATHISIPVTNRKVRVISDIDDTVKVADVLSGVKTIFNNVFVKGLEELIVPGMSSFYQKLYRRGVRFHYVSNSPYGLLPILTEFLQIAELPQGSLRLRFYGGRSLFGGLWEPAGERKRGGVVHVLDNFRDSQFFLIGDTGEQDLDLYVELAKERPDQILGIFLRDVVPLIQSSSFVAGQILEGKLTDEPQSVYPSPGPQATSFQPPNRASSGSRPVPYTPYRPRSRSGTDPKSLIQQQPQQAAPMQLPRSFIDDEPIIPGGQTNQEQTKLTPIERKRRELDSKIAIAKQTLPPHIVFRVFRDAEENKEAFEILDSLL
ncbi:hypothetical protein CPB86DRAFT_772208 [Serendipita vermifera]|nr:hypothetical protein CPB86DRAFT_772208 [Serendipita vermifera]